jgi:hypothetical protein
VSQSMKNGGRVATPIKNGPAKNSTLATPTLSVAVAVW